jgi:uncharacterized protein (TIGR04255 family)
MSGVLPKFDNPPIKETVVGVQFRPLTKWQIHHIGLYAARIRSHFPNVSIQPPLPDDSETFDNGQQSIRISLANPRVWFGTATTEWIIQIQNSRFISNWRRLLPEAKYPEWKAFKEHFDKEYERFCDFLKKEEIDTPEPEMVEVSYINHIAEFEDWSDVFPTLRKREQPFLGKPSATEIRSAFPIEGDLGRLYIRAEPVVRHTDGEEVIQMTLTAKLSMASNSNSDVSKLMKLGHEWVVCGFEEFTTPEMHEKWMRKK